MKGEGYARRVGSSVELFIVTDLPLDKEGTQHVNLSFTRDFHEPWSAAAISRELNKSIQDYQRAIKKEFYDLGWKHAKDKVAKLFQETP